MEIEAAIKSKIEHSKKIKRNSYGIQGNLLKNRKVHSFLTNIYSASTTYQIGVSQVP